MKANIKIEVKIISNFLEIKVNEIIEKIAVYKYLSPLDLPELIVDFDYYEGRLN